MQRVIIFLYLLIGVSNINAQPQPGDYIINNDINKFVGTWQWAQGTDTLKLIFTKVKMYYAPPGNFHADALMGWHQYIKNGVLIESSFQLITSNPTLANTTILGSTSTDPNEVSFGIDDMAKHKRGHVDFKLQAGSLTAATWKLENYEDIRINPTAPFDGTFTFPLNLSFHKL
jgi:hypothetical protein